MPVRSTSVYTFGQCNCKAVDKGVITLNLSCFRDMVTMIGNDNVVQMTVDHKLKQTIGPSFLSTHYRNIGFRPQNHI